MWPYYLSGFLYILEIKGSINISYYLVFLPALMRFGVGVIVNFFTRLETASTQPIDKVDWIAYLILISMSFVIVTYALIAGY